MSLLQHEIDIFTDSHPGEVVERIRQDSVEIRLKDAGSARAALVSMGAFGRMMAERQAREQYAARPQGSNPGPTYEYLLERSQQGVTKIFANLKVAAEQTELGDQLGFTFTLANEEADLLVDTMKETPALTQRLEGDMLTYYADLMPTLLAEAELSVDSYQFKYSI